MNSVIAHLLLNIEINQKINSLPFCMIWYIWLWLIFLRLEILLLIEYLIKNHYKEILESYIKFYIDFSYAIAHT